MAIFSDPESNQKRLATASTKRNPFLSRHFQSRAHFIAVEPLNAVCECHNNFVYATIEITTWRTFTHMFQSIRRRNKTCRRKGKIKQFRVIFAVRLSVYFSMFQFFFLYILTCFESLFFFSFRFISF